MKQLKQYFFAILFLLVFAMSANADTLDQSQQFFISSQYDAQSRTMITATLIYISNRAYFYAADDYWNGANASVREQIIDQIKLLAQEFDSRIYPIETQFFGSEPNPGIDGDQRITILLTPLIQNAGGYFDTANQYPIAEVRDSNQREMIYLNIKEIASLNKMFAFLAHEFQHLISFNQKENLRRVSDDIWLNELRSEYAVTLLGYNNVFDDSHLERRVNALQNDPADSLTEWKNLSADYGQIGLLGEYIAEHWSPQVIADTLKNNLKSIPSLNDALARNGFSDTFADVYRNWLIANFLNDPSSNNRFSYANKGLNDFHVNSTRTINGLSDGAPLTIADTIKDWQGRWYDISFAPGRSNILKIALDSPSLTSFFVSYVVFGADGAYNVYSFNPAPGSNMIYIPGIGADVKRVVIMPVKKDKLSGFSANETPIMLSTSFERVESAPDNAFLPSPLVIPLASINNSTLETSNYKLETNLPDGSLVRARGDFKVYIIKGKWRRHITDSKIFNFYSGLGFDRVTEVDASVLEQYQVSELVRYAGDQKVYAVNENSMRQWLNMAPQQFSASGRAWDSIFEINLRELQFYKVGSNITR
ncbi:MAG: hypothetical protein HYT65_02855 [Candidatus Yanofskybacteria bacterium]|nr:hypothetical protein [Candidatus Yanofskybacteria bacterium]